MTPPTKSPSETKPAPGNQTHECTKPGCYFCYATQDRPERIQPTVLQSKLNDKNSQFDWQPYEIDILYSKHASPMPELTKLLPNRSYDAIKNKRFWVRRKLGLPPLQRGNSLRFRI